MLLLLKLLLKLVRFPANPPTPTPARLQIPQPFDGDGLLAIFAFKGGRAFFANRYVRTEGEAAAIVEMRVGVAVGPPAHVPAEWPL